MAKRKPGRPKSKTTPKPKTEPMPREFVLTENPKSQPERKPLKIPNYQFKCTDENNTFWFVNAQIGELYLKGKKPKGIVSVEKVAI